MKSGEIIILAAGEAIFDLRFLPAPHNPQSEIVNPKCVHFVSVPLLSSTIISAQENLPNAHTEFAGAFETRPADDRDQQPEIKSLATHLSVFGSCANAVHHFRFSICELRFVVSGCCFSGANRI